jgi:rubrerythrin
MKRLTVAGCIAALLVAVAGVSFAADAKNAMPKMPEMKMAVPQTIANLEAAYSGESTAKEKYLAYAVQAEKEGYAKVAQLFRGSARSEEIHAAVYAKALSGLGTAPKAVIGKFNVKSTKENLEDAISGEKYESESMYPKFLEQAKTDNVKLAMIGFGSAMKVEVNHLALFNSALKDLQAWKQADKNGFYVCNICGNLVPKLDFAACAVCGAPQSKFPQVK